MKLLARFAVAAALTSVAAAASAASVLAQTPQGSYTTNVLGGSAWSNFTSQMEASHTVTRTADFSSLTELMAYDAAWVDQELSGSLSAAEIASLQSYIGAGHRAVLIGENSGWPAWNASVMDVVGGAVTPGCSFDVGAPTVTNALTAGINTVQNICGSMVQPTGGAQILFSNSMAALYQVGAGQALVIMDSNWNDNSYIGNQNNALFAQNVIAWLQPVPEPQTYALMLAGLASLAALRRRRGL